MASADQLYDVAAIVGGLCGDGIIGLPWRIQSQMGRPAAPRGHGLVRRGNGGSVRDSAPRAAGWYVEVQPERISGFVDIATHPWFVAVCEAALTKDSTPTTAEARRPFLWALRRWRGPGPGMALW